MRLMKPIAINDPRVIMVNPVYPHLNLDEAENIDVYFMEEVRDLPIRDVDRFMGTIDTVKIAGSLHKMLTVRFETMGNIIYQSRYTPPPSGTKGLFHPAEKELILIIARCSLILAFNEKYHLSE